MLKRLFFFMALVSCATYGHAATDPWTESYRLESLSQFENAIRSLQPVIKKDPRHELAITRSGWLHYLAGNHNQAIQHYENAMKINPQSLEARLGLLLPLLAQQRWREATSHAQKVLHTAPWNYYAHIRLMMAEEGQRKWETLAKHATRVHQRYPSDATVLVYLARAHLWLRNDRDARQAYKKVLQRVPGHIEALQYLGG